MFRFLCDRLADSLGALRSIANLHPGVFGVSAWSAPHSPAPGPRRRVGGQRLPD